jgi:signal transduction histidine kinase
MRTQLTALAVVPSVCAALLAVAAVAVLTRASGKAQLLHGRTLDAISVLGGLTVLVVVVGFVWAGHVARSARRTVVEVVRVPAPGPVPAPAAAPVVPSAPVVAQPAASSAPAAGTAPAPAAPMAADRGVFVHLSHRLQSLVHRQIQLLDALENDVEEPDLLKGLFGVDHIATRMRRHAENLAVLGGAVPRRQWTKPVSVMEILRSAVSETIDYARVQVIARAPGSLNGYAVADVIHLLAELVENATTFSPPDTKVVLRTQAVAAGLVIEIDDRGLGLPQPEYDRLNALLREPAEVNVRELLEGARIGLYVVAQLARRHGIAIRLQTNITGGTQALVVLPKPLLATESREYDQPIREIPAPVAASAAAPPVPVPAGPLYVREGVVPGPRRPANASPASLPPPQGPPVLQGPPVPLGPYQPAPSSAGLPLNIPSETHLPGIPISPGSAAAASYTPGIVPNPRPPTTADERPVVSPSDPRTRPPLPRRRPQEHLATPLAQSTAAAGNPADRVGEGLSPNLMADFRRGLSLGAADPGSDTHPHEHAPTQEGER